uniref:Uncharacterized protein n=1 Tax=Heterosigma akashiwo TaxID=2829 RepID=A0A7S3YLB9_HETAK
MPSAAHQGGQDGLGQERRAEEVDRHHPLLHRAGGLQGGASRAHARVVDQHVHPAGFAHPLPGPLHSGQVRHVEGRRGHDGGRQLLVPPGGALGRGRTHDGLCGSQPVRVAPGKHHIGP